jgi:hypothetical protein
LLLGEILASDKKRLQVEDDILKSIYDIQQQQAFLLCLTLGLQTTWYKYEVLLQMYWATLESLLGT